MSTTDPVDEHGTHTAPRLAIAPFYKDPRTGATYVHHDLQLREGPWAEEAHIPPMNVTEKFGDVESFVEYVKTYRDPDDLTAALLTWNSLGLRATLDYASADTGPGRCQWQADHRFEKSRQWQAWMNMASGKVMSQKDAIERLEDLRDDIVEPDVATLMGILRSLRGSVNAKAMTELRADGSTSVSFQKETNVRAGADGSLELPAAIKISIPALAGHYDAETGKTKCYIMEVRIQAAPDDSGRLELRFRIPAAERALEVAYEDRASRARELLGETFTLLRAAG